MCGIAGIVMRQGRGIDEPQLRTMTDTLKHRGPDAGGTHIDKNVGLGHRRLSIIDTSTAANQPLFNEDGSVAVVFNGEIYNFQDLTPALAARGHRFTTRSDTEVIVHAWEEYGPKCVERFRGMFAFAVYDSRQGILFLARDRLGKKPLFYSSTPDRFAFGSEIKALLSLPRFDKEVDLAAFGEYAAYGNSLGERTIYRHIRKLPPAHFLLLNCREPDLNPNIQRYWDIEPKPDRKPTEQEWLEEVDRVLSESVRLRMISDVPLGAFLSGGIDSSLVAAYMGKHSNHVKTFTIGFKESSHDESTHAAAVARHLKTDHYMEYVTPDAMQILPELVEAYDEPFADSSALPTFYLSRMTRQHVTVALSGDGGDEVFLGYPRYPIAHAVNWASWLLTPPGRKLAGYTAGKLRPRWFSQHLLEVLSKPGFDIYHYLMGHSEVLLSLIRPDIRTQLPPVLQCKMFSDYHHHPRLQFREKIQYLDLMNYLPEDILVKVDRASMHYSLEVRCPLLDQDLIELATRIPLHMKLAGFNGKRILKHLAYRYIPRDLLERPKMGFGVPLGVWFKGELATALQEMLADTGSRMWDYYDRAAAEQRIQEHLSHQADASFALWRLLFFYHWCARHL